MCAGESNRAADSPRDEKRTADLRQLRYMGRLENSHSLPLLNHPLDSESEFTPQALIEAVRTRRRLASVAVPEVCVLEFDGDITDHLVENRAVSAWPNWACFHTPMFAIEVDGKSCGIVPRAIGGSYAVLVAEQLLASGASVIVGLTSAGRVSPDLPIPSLVIATAAIRDEGTSFHYLPPSRSVTAPPKPVPFLSDELKRLGLPLQAGTVWTTDAPYRETRQQLDLYADEGVLAVEMQAASLFALAQARNAKIAVVAHVSNATDHEGEPFDRGAETETLQVLKAICRAGLAVVTEMRSRG
jgi:uridine phosphorylase